MSVSAYYQGRLKSIEVSWRVLNALWIARTVPIAAHRKFPYLNVLDAHLTHVNGRIFVEIKTLSLHDHEGVASIKGNVEADDEEQAEAWVEALLARAYSQSLFRCHDACERTSGPG